MLYPSSSGLGKKLNLERRKLHIIDWYVAEIQDNRPGNTVLLSDAKNSDIRKSHIACVSYSLSVMSRPDSDNLYDFGVHSP